LKAAGLLLLIVFSVHSLAPLYANGQPFTRESWRPVVDYVVSRATAKDGIVFDQSFARIPFEYYFHEMYPRAKNPTPIWPSAPWGEPDETWQWPSIKAMEYQRLWRIFLYQIPTNLEYRWRPQNSETPYCLIQSQSFPFILVTVYQSCP